MEKLFKLNLCELSKDEKVNTIGGDTFMKDLGYAIGSGLKAVYNSLIDFSHNIDAMGGPAAFSQLR